MPKASEFGIGSVQAVFYTPNVGAFSQSKVLADIFTHASTRYDGPPTSLPPLEGLPPDLPRVLLRSSDGAWHIRAAPGRIDSLWAHPTMLADAGELATIVAQCSEVIEHYVHTSSVHVGRLALVVLRGHVLPDPAQTLIDLFCNESSKRAPFNRSLNFELHNHKRYQPADLDQAVNSWVRCRTSLVQQSSGIGVEQDINTLEEVGQNTLSADQIHNFFIRVPAEMDSVLRLYFPEEA